MQTTIERRFRAVKFRFETDARTHRERYMVVDNHVPLFRVNQWLELKSMRKASTGQEYAKKMTVYLNWLDSRGISYEDATNRHVRQFLHSLIFGDLQNGKIKSIQSTVSSSTLKKYITVITGFYRWLDDIYRTEMVWNSKNLQANRSYLYGQIYSYEYRYLVDGFAAMLKSSREYTKWYDADTKENLCRNFNTFRDEAVLLLTFEGLRIDEALSITFDSYNATDRLIQPTRSKGRTDARGGNNHLRTVALPKQTSDRINAYILTERAAAETESNKISQYLFINLEKGRSQGMPLSYHNYLKILKRCAKRAGLDASKIRTHNGRSTKVMDFLEHQAIHPEDGITDVIIMESFGWRSFDSIDHYRDHNNQVIAKAVMEKLHKRDESDD
jgi:site-specific recombinase XerD